MPHRTRILDGEREYLVVESPAGNLGLPVLRVFTRADNDEFVLPGGLPEFSTEQGNWILVAHFEEGELRLAGGGIEGPLERLGLIVRRYQHERAEAAQRSTPPYYYLLVRGRPLGILHDTQPGGLMLLLFREEEVALVTLRERKEEGTVATCGALPGFLSLRAEEGYAGAILDHTEPVFWCLDKEEQLCFLKFHSVSETDEFEGQVLDPRGHWRAFEDRDDLEFVEDQDRWDDLMVRYFGHVPFLGHEQGMPWFGLFEGSQLVLVQDAAEEETTTRTLPLFHDEQEARKFATMHDMPQVDVIQIRDLRGLLREAASHGAVARLHPEDHRARGGSLWLDGEQVVLDSFSGFWRSQDLKHFVAVA